MTVDKHGLRHKFLEAHEPEVAAFVDSLAHQSFSSDAAESLQEHLLKCWGKLFTFIHHDGVSWNNTYAENAIRYFAYYRDKVKGVMTTDGLGESVFLLSIFQTCRYRGISFLRFMLSREVHQSASVIARDRRSAGPFLETFPDGYIPANFAKLYERQKRQPLDGQQGEAFPTGTGETQQLVSDRCL